MIAETVSPQCPARIGCLARLVRLSWDLVILQMESIV